MGRGDLALQISFWVTYPEIAPVYPRRTKPSQGSASRAGSVLPKKGEWQLSNIRQLGTLRMIAVGETGRTLEKKHTYCDRTGRGEDDGRMGTCGTDLHGGLVFMDELPMDPK